MREDRLSWEKKDTRLLLKTVVFNVLEQKERASNGIEGNYIALDGLDCVVVLPRTADGFIMVRQWRHGADRLSLEFPGGVIDKGESPETAAKRELLEETGRKAGKLIFLGECSPNPAVFKSRLHFYLAEDLKDTGVLHPDDDELLELTVLLEDEVIEGFGQGELCHAFMGTAIAFYLRYKKLL